MNPSDIFKSSLFSTAANSLTGGLYGVGKGIYDTVSNGINQPKPALVPSTSPGLSSNALSSSYPGLTQISKPTPTLNAGGNSSATTPKDAYINSQNGMTASTAPSNSTASPYNPNAGQFGTGAGGATSATSPTTGASDPYRASFDAYLASLTPSDAENSASKYLSDLQLQSQKDAEKASNMGETTGFAAGETARVNHNNAFAIDAASNALNALTGKRTAQTAATKARLDFEQSLQPDNKLQEISPGASLYDPKTGKSVFTAPTTAGQNGSGSGSALLSPTEAQALGVPYGTTQAGAYGKTPQKPLTESQGKDVTYAQRANDANQYINELESTVAGYNPALFGGESAIEGNVIGNAFVDKNIQSVRQAERNFVTAILRRESGASINASEFSTAEKQYFPRPGDSEQTLAQKAQARAAAINSFVTSAGSNAFPTGLSTTPVPNKGISVSAGGQNYTFPDQASADAFKKAAGIQ